MVRAAASDAAKAAAGDRRRMEAKATGINLAFICNLTYSMICGQGR